MKRSWYVLGAVIVGCVLLLSRRVHYSFSPLVQYRDQVPIEYLSLMTDPLVSASPIHSSQVEESCRDYQAPAMLDRTGSMSSDHVTKEDIAFVTQNGDLEQRSKWQMAQVDRFCTKYGEDSQLYVYPSGHQANILNRHLIFSHEKQFLFCFLPKTGCTTLRRLIFLMEGLIPPDTVEEAIVPETILRKAMAEVSYLNKHITISEKLNQIKTYFKFVMIRNPLERLVSAFRDKIEPPLEFCAHDQQKDPLVHFIKWKEMDLFQAYRRYIFSKYDPDKLIDWAKSGGSYPLSVNFTTYIKWILDTSDEKLNEHFSSILYNSAPCRVGYDLFVNFKNYSREVRLLIDKLNTSTDYFTDHSAHGKPSEQTYSTLPRYFSLLSLYTKKKLLARMSKDLDFYYHLYPEDCWSHMEILGLRYSDSHLTTNLR